VSIDLTAHLGTLPNDLAEAISSTFRDVMNHFLKEEWDDAQVDAGRFCEAALRYLEWKMNGSFTPIDGKSKPNRKNVVNAAKQDTNLAASLRAQMPQGIELTMDFRNNRNSAHLGNIDANKLDATTVVSNVSWMVSEVVRLETQKPSDEVQTLLDRLAERHVPLIQTVNGQPIVLQPGLSGRNRALIILYQQGKPLPLATLRKFVGYANPTRFRDVVIKGMAKEALVHLDAAGDVTLLVPGEAEAQRIILAAGGL
jgi:hypothetical protein